MAANREVRGLSEESAKLVEAAKPVDDTPEGHANLGAALAELESRPGIDCQQELADHERRWQDLPMASVEAIILELAREERKHAPKAPKRQATRRRPGASDATTGQPGASSDVVESLPESPDTPLEPITTDLPHPGEPVENLIRIMPGHPQQLYTEPPEPGTLWQGGKALPMDTQGRPLPPGPSPPTPPRGTTL